MKPVMASTLASATDAKENANGSTASTILDVDVKGMERNNLLLLSRLVIRGLLQFCMESKNRLLTSEHQQLLDTFVMIEKVVRHGFKTNRNFVALRSAEQELWIMFEKLGRLSREAEEAVACVQQLPNVHSAICRVRAFLRLAVMQKKLADYFQLLVEAKPLLSENYEDWALLKHETSGIVFAGSLIALRVLDCNLYLKEDDLNRQDSESSESEETESKRKSWQEMLKEMKSVLDQKNYLEERNRQLLANVTNMQRRLVVLEGMRRHKSITSEIGENGVEKALVPGESVGDAVEIDLLPLTKVEELETAMTLMEKDVHEKQDTIISLRQQIDDVKKINVDLYQKLRENEDSRKNKDKLIARLEKEVEKDQSAWRNKVTTMEKRIEDLDNRAVQAEGLSNTLQAELKQKDSALTESKQNFDRVQEEMRMLSESRTAERLVREDLDTKLRALQVTEKEYLELKDKYDDASHRASEYEKALEEMGVHLSESKLKVEDMREGFMPLAEAQWESDKDVLNCKQCNEIFSVSRRKHHCRNCGGIFCHSCSENTMPLPSSAKPVRVCDACYAMLLSRYSAKNPESNA